MKVIIAGSRNIHEFDIVSEAVRVSGFYSKDMEVVSGTANGVDKLGETFAEIYDLKCHRFPADWDTYGKRAGPFRNIQMAEFADALIAIWDGESKGTKHMIKEAKKRGLKVFVYMVPEVSLFEGLS